VLGRVIHSWKTKVFYYDEENKEGAGTVWIRKGYFKEL